LIYFSSETIVSIFKIYIMNDEQKAEERNGETHQKSVEPNPKLEEKIDEELEESFPASDPPSFSEPGNDDIKRNT